MQKKFILGLGGSIICPYKIDTAYLRRFYKFIKNKIHYGYKFVIVTGGGDTARKYQKAALKVANVSDEDKDWIGIHATRLNAHLLRTIFKKEADPVVFDKRFHLKDFNRHSIIIASGWRPGWSTDYVAIQIAADLKIDNIVILTKPDYVYSADPKRDKNAKPLKEITWKEYIKKIPSKWKPGLHLPIDPIASRLAQKEKMKVILINGKKLSNLEKVLNGEKFKGTIIY
jgi:uridylate kinase